MLLHNTHLHQSLVRTLGGGGPGTSARWWKVAVELSKQPALNKRIDLHWIQDIEAGSPSGPTRATAFLSELTDALKISTRTFIAALRAALLEISADEVEAALQSIVLPEKQMTLPYQAPPIAATTASVCTSSSADWSLRWAHLCFELCQQLPVDSLSVLRTAFNCHGAMTVQHFLISRIARVSSLVQRHDKIAATY